MLVEQALFVTLGERSQRGEIGTAQVDAVFDQASDAEQTGGPERVVRDDHAWRQVAARAQTNTARYAADRSRDREARFANDQYVAGSCTQLDQERRFDDGGGPRAHVLDCRGRLRSQLPVQRVVALEGTHVDQTCVAIRLDSSHRTEARHSGAGPQGFEVIDRGERAGSEGFLTR